MLDFTSTSLPKGSGAHGAHRRTLSSFAPVDSRSSSLNHVWAEDYFTNEQNENYFNSIIAHPPPATVTERSFPRSIPLSEDEEQATSRQRTHQRSLTALLPFRSRTNSTSPQRSPDRSPLKDKFEDSFDFMPTLTGDKEGTIKLAEKRSGGLSSWFSGSSAPVSVGVPVEEFDSSTVFPPPNSASRTQSPERGAPAKLRKRPTMPTIDTTSSAAAVTPPKSAAPSTSRFAFFGGSKTAVQKTVSIPASMDDEFLNLDIRNSLFPSGLADTDTFSPSAFKNLITNAEGLLTKLQTAYKVRTLALHELSAEKEAQAEELEEAETRAKHLKMQLQDMATQVMAQDEEMKAIRAELEQEKEERRKEHEAREKSIALIRAQPTSPSHPRTSEDLGVDSRMHRRFRSRTSDTSFESDDESRESDSVFSRCMSPTLPGTNESTPEIVQATWQKVQVVNITPTSPVRSNPTSVKQMRPKTLQQRSTFDKMLKGIVSEVKGDSKQEQELGTGEQDEGCSNCRGGPSAVAWDTVGLLRAENRGLKERVGMLETSVEGALDLVRGLGHA